MRIGTAFRAFFAALFNGQTEQRIALALSEAVPALEPLAEEEKPKPQKKAEKSSQNAAITLLAALQREARFVDFVQESLDGYSDAQIGAAARSVHDDCAKVVARFFALESVIDQPDESTVEITPEAFSFFTISGNVDQKPPFSGKLIHAGWKATALELPEWAGQPELAMLVAPAEVEVR